MRVTLILVVLLVCSVLGRRSGARNRKDRNEARLAKLNGTDMAAVSGKLDKLRRNWRKKLTLDSATNEELKDKMKNMRAKRRERIRAEGDTLAEVNEKANITGMYQGDIVLTEKQADIIVEESENGSRARRQAYRDRFYPSTIWGNTVYFYFDSSASTAARTVFLKAAAYWQANTCINFQESTSARNRIKVFKDSGCYSYIGMIGGVQELSLGSGCESVGTAAHELGHALGFFHTQSRFDRDSSIIVNVNNIVDNFVDQFDKETSSTNFNYGMPYDYGSVMQYGALSASKNGNPTMVARDSNYQDTMGSDIVGFYDVSMINEHYNCKARCPAASSANCQNGGFPNPRSCSVCICPSGFGGSLCNQRPSGCGRTTTATSSFQTLSDTIGDGSRNVNDDFSKCNYWIQAPAGSRIEVRLKSFSGTFSDGCSYSGVEIKAQSDEKRTGYRFCDNDYVGKSLISTSNVVPVITFNRYRSSTTQVEFRTVGGSASPNPAPAPSSSCTDAHASCPSFVSNGFCQSTYYTAAQKMFYCAASCNLC